MPRGRPTFSEVRNRMIEILFQLKKAYGYEIYKVYKALYPKVTLRVIYYHLKKGVALEEFKVNKVEKSHGDYSWGPEAEKIYYSLGPNAKPVGSQEIRDYLNKSPSEDAATQ